MSGSGRSRAELHRIAERRVPSGERGRDHLGRLRPVREVGVHVEVHGDRAPRRVEREGGARPDRGSRRTPRRPASSMRSRAPGSATFGTSAPARRSRARRRTGRTEPPTARPACRSGTCSPWPRRRTGRSPTRRPGRRGCSPTGRGGRSTAPRVGPGRSAGSRTSSSTTARWMLESVVVRTSITIERIAIATQSSTRVIPRSIVGAVGSPRSFAVSRHLTPAPPAVAGRSRGRRGHRGRTSRQVDLVHTVDDVLVADRDLDRMRDRLGVPAGLGVGGSAVCDVVVVAWLIPPAATVTRHVTRGPADDLGLRTRDGERVERRVGRGLVRVAGAVVVEEGPGGDGRGRVRGLPLAARSHEPCPSSRPAGRSSSCRASGSLDIPAGAVIPDGGEPAELDGPERAGCRDVDQPVLARARRSIPVDLRGRVDRRGRRSGRGWRLPTDRGDMRHGDRDGRRSRLPDVPTRARARSRSPASPWSGHAYVSVPFASTDVARCSCSPAGTDAMSPIWLQQSAFRCERRESTDGRDGPACRRRSGRLHLVVRIRRGLLVPRRIRVPVLSMNCEPGERRDGIQLLRLLLLGRAAESPGSVSVNESKSTAKSCSCPVTSRRGWGESTWP